MPTTSAVVLEPMSLVEVKGSENLGVSLNCVLAKEYFVRHNTAKPDWVGSTSSAYQKPKALVAFDQVFSDSQSVPRHTCLCLFGPRHFLQ